MEVSEIKQQIIHKQPSNFYIFTGEEFEVRNIYIDKLAECRELTKVNTDTIESIYSKLQAKSFIQKYYCYVVRDDEEFMKNEKVWDKIKTVIGNNMLILVYTEIDKRKAFYKHYKGDIATFEHLPINILVKHIKQQINLNEEASKYLVDICGSDYSRILLEIDKIKAYSNATGNTNMNKCFDELLDDGAIYEPPIDSAFEFVNVVLKSKITKAFKLYKCCVELNQSTIGLMQLLYSNARQVLQVQTAGNKDVEQSTGLTAWQIKCAREKTGYYSNDELIQILQLIQETDLKIRLGEIEESIAIPYILINIYKEV